MKFGIRVPSVKKRISARTSVKRIVRHNLGLKAPRGLGLVTNPKKSIYNRIYNRTTVPCTCCGGFAVLGLVMLAGSLLTWRNRHET